MNKLASKLIALLAFSLLSAGAVVPANAAPGDKPKEEGVSNLPEDIVEIAFISVISVTVLSVLVGTGRSIKYNMDVAKAEAESALEPSDISEDTAEHDETPEMVEEEVLAVKEIDLNHNENIHPNHELITSSHYYENSNGHASVNGNGHHHHAESKNSDSQSVVDKEKLSAKDLNLATNQYQLQELQKHLYRQKYQKLQEQVRLLPSFAQSPTKEIDIWEVDVEVALMVLAESPENDKEVEQVLLQSDQVREWAVSLPEEDFQVKAGEYIEKTFSWAQELRKWRERHVSA